MLPAAVGSKFLKNGPKHFTSENPLCGPPNGKKTLIHIILLARPLFRIKKTSQDRCKISIFAFQPDSARTCMHHTCHLVLARRLFIFPAFSHVHVKECFPVGSKFLKSGRKHFTSEDPCSDPQTARNPNPDHLVSANPLPNEKKSPKTNAESTFSLFSPTRPAHVCITLAIWCLRGGFVIFLIFHMLL